MRNSGTSVVVLVCDGHQEDGQNLGSVTALVAQLLPDASVQILRNLCIRPSALTKARRKFAGDVVVLSPCLAHAKQRVSAVELRNAVRDRWAPPKRIVITDPTNFITRYPLQRSRIHAVSIAATALAEPALVPVLAPVEPVLDGIGRRALLTGRLRPSRPRPQSTDGACAASPLCHLCVDSCPTSALSMAGGVPVVDSSSCTACGACVTACPTDAICLDPLPRHGWEAYLEHVLSAAQQLDLSLGIWWICRHAEAPSVSTDDVTWLRLRLPCLSAATLAWVLQPLAAGAEAVAVTPCDSCATSWAPKGSRSQLVQQLVGTQIFKPFSSSSIWGAVTPHLASARIELREPTATTEALTRLDVSHGPLIASSASPLGLVDCDANLCTSCGLCAKACPTNALAVRDARDSWTLAFAHGECAACGACVETCPESALTLRRGIESTALQGSNDLAVAKVRRCEACDAALPSPVLIRRFAAVGVHIPDDGICGDCRSAGRLASRAVLLT